jgi:hypothetical protein
MPSFKVFSIAETDLTSSERTNMLKNKTIFCQVQTKVKNDTWKNTNNIIVKNQNGTNEIVQMNSYDIMNTLHRGSYMYKQDISGYCFQDDITTESTNVTFQLSDLLYSGYTYTDMTGIVFDYTNMCNLTDYYSMVKLDDNNILHPNKYERIYKFPVPLKLET